MTAHATTSIIFLFMLREASKSDCREARKWVGHASRLIALTMFTQLVLTAVLQSEVVHLYKEDDEEKVAKTYQTYLKKYPIGLVSDLSTVALTIMLFFFVRQIDQIVRNLAKNERDYCFQAEENMFDKSTTAAV